MPPRARIDVFERDDPEGVRLQATVDIEDTDAVMNVVMDALFDIQVERGLPVYVVTEQRLPRVTKGASCTDVRRPASCHLCRNAGEASPPNGWVLEKAQMNGCP